MLKETLRILRKLEIMGKKICIIGAGPSGITAAKNCMQAGLDFVLFEKNNKVG